MRGGGDGGTETGARTRTGKDGDLGEKKRRDKRGRGCWLLAAGCCRLIHGAQGLAGWCPGSQWWEGPKAETGSARDWLVTEQNPPRSIRVRAGQPTAFWNVGRLQNTQHRSGLSLVVASSVPDCDQQQISSSNIPGNQLDQSGHQPRVPLRLHLWRWGRLCATMGSWGGTRLHLARPFLFSLFSFLFFPLKCPRQHEQQTWRRGGRGGQNLPGSGVCSRAETRARTFTRWTDSGHWTEMQRAASRRRSSSEITDGACSQGGLQGPVPPPLTKNAKAKARLPTARPRPGPRPLTAGTFVVDPRVTESRPLSRL